LNQGFSFLPPSSGTFLADFWCEPIGHNFFLFCSYDSNSGGEREIQRTMLELLNQLDGFDSRGDVKVIMATNRIETLDPALIRPGRIDRKIEFPLPDMKTKRRIFSIHTSRMSMAKEVDLEDIVSAKDDLSGADVKAICTEAGLLALRERRMRVTHEDFTKAKEKVLYRKNENTPEGTLFLFFLLRSKSNTREDGCPSAGRRDEFWWKGGRAHMKACA
jgi:SpoVK/Ycf46/Vps4 family AAA+-type ATPase